MNFSFKYWFLMLNNGFNFILTELKMVGELKPQILQKRNHLSSISTRKELGILKRAFRALRLRLLGISREYILNLAPRFVSADSLHPAAGPPSSLVTWQPHGIKRRTAAESLEKLRAGCPYPM